VADWWRDFFDATYRDLWSARTTPVRTALDADGIEAVLEKHGAPNPARIVDLGCGDGRISVALTVRGHHVTGLDYSASMLAAARDRAAQFDTQVELVEADVRDAHRHVTGVDVALSWYTSFGYFDDTADDLAALESARASLAPGGLLLLETQHRDKVAALHAEVSPQRLYEERPDGIVLRELWFDPIRGRAGEHVRQLRADGTAEDRAFSLRVYSATELVALCAAAGLTLEAVYGGPGPTPFSVSTRLLVVARRAA
jgi:SAM-dependent methyltransferase